MVHENWLVPGPVPSRLDGDIASPDFEKDGKIGQKINRIDAFLELCFGYHVVELDTVILVLDDAASNADMLEEGEVPYLFARVQLD